ncbi:hypothetical protein DSO57_1003319 [Entomophthora muscae]|uniref:Uncharacterized protein n=1 Tax=Entomophthora muscae TaxID=34485 RepID=A0ACC2T8Q6_9FUNG|nr:hypothetical protein DSO57_1003319 [Entomophthora muscae]
MAEQNRNSRISTSYSRSYFSNLFTQSDENGQPASYTQDEDTIRNQTLALANQGLKAVSDEYITDRPSAAVTQPPRGYQSNLSQLINSQVNHQNITAPQASSNANSPQVAPVVICNSDLENSDEEDFEEDLKPHSPKLRANKSAPTTPFKSTQSNSYFESVESTPLLKNDPPSPIIYEAGGNFNSPQQTVAPDS